MKLLPLALLLLLSCSADTDELPCVNVIKHNRTTYPLPCPPPGTGMATDADLDAGKGDAQ